ncbi:sugar phosphate isomerase/epimerase family protein [Flexivirga oryzae]|uniref:Inosose dehydratase n=1 Tax=Flexivirga oryzae TaxID=1794944 RepID=A0A839N362_9MICO|nr:sugar phosphate isomerase/epimerase [Flexivirga oryzae]MBB2890076.1 inosose dehydratase [Flexivirga oryzae]
MSRPLRQRVAAAPISWGVCEVPDWGFQLDPATVLTQMRELGLVATEFGPEGFLPDDPRAKAETLRGYGLSAVGQFVPVVLHDPAVDPLPTVERAMTALLAARADTVVIAAATGTQGYDSRPQLDDLGWSTLLSHLDLIEERAGARGLRAALHPHVGTMVESGEETERVLAGSRIGLCLDTGHILVGGGDPVAIARSWTSRIRHTHLKDVRAELAEAVRTGTISYTEAVSRGMYVPLGRGDVDLGAIIDALESHDYDGWYVLEQDTILAADPARTGAGPEQDVRASLEFVLARSS